jgi:ribosomal protein S18 acetylase RimI-like enzyme
MSFEIKRISISDLAILEKIQQELIDPELACKDVAHLTQLLADDRTYVWAAVQGAHIVGYALAYRFPALYGARYLAYLYDIEVLESHRRQGIGRGLMAAALAALKFDGVDEVWLGTATDNLEAQALFTAMGGTSSGETFLDFTFEI